MQLRGTIIGFCALLAGVARAQAPAAGEKDGPGLALFTAKALVCSWDGEQVVDNAVVLVKDGRIESVVPRAAAAIPVGYVVRDLGPLWCMPGMIDLHSHVGGAMDINDMVYVTNPELRVSTSVIPDNPNFRRAVAGAVTSVLFIPGSGTNSGGQGILLKTGLPKYEESVLRDPGSLKVAQWGNPERYLFGVGKTFENYHIRQMFTQGRAYWKAWKDFESGTGPKPEKNIRFELLRALFNHETQISTHTQVAQVVMMTIVMIRGEFGLDVYIDHGEFGGYIYAGLAKKMGVPAILGPRNVDAPTRSVIDWVGTNPERMQGLAAGYAEAGHDMIGFNTDANVIPQEELFLQSAMNVRFGFDNSNMAAVRGHTIVPAKTAKIDARVGSLEKGKDADIVVLTGDPSDPRSAVELVLIEGRVVYDTKLETRRF
ncbi:MAG: amidohydrolase family protein [Planctomycetes bacterium]|nr:amidohydrolase family protein [Planctomycetota bacterium]